MKKPKNRVHVNGPKMYQAKEALLGYASYLGRRERNLLREAPSRIQAQQGGRHNHHQRPRSPRRRWMTQSALACSMTRTT